MFSLALAFHEYRPGSNLGVATIINFTGNQAHRKVVWLRLISMQSGCNTGIGSTTAQRLYCRFRRYYRSLIHEEISGCRKRGETNDCSGKVGPSYGSQNAVVRMVPRMATFTSFRYRQIIFVSTLRLYSPLGTRRRNHSQQLILVHKRTLENVLLNKWKPYLPCWKFRGDFKIKAKQSFWSWPGKKWPLTASTISLAPLWTTLFNKCIDKGSLPGGWFECIQKGMGIPYIPHPGARNSERELCV